MFSGSSLSRVGSGLRRDQQVGHSKSGERVIQEREGQEAPEAHERGMPEAAEVTGVMSSRASWMNGVCTWSETGGEKLERQTWAGSRRGSGETGRKVSVYS